MNGMHLLLCIVTPVSLPFVFVFLWRLSRHLSQQAQIDLNRDIETILEKFQIESYEVVCSGL